jgi:osmotically-inducible protein OsmY
MCVDRLLLGAVFLLWATSVQAGANRLDSDAARDLRQTMEARKLLADEPELEAFNIGVTVHNRVATLWGPVPSIDVAFRAELALRTMFELTAVRNELFVSELVQPMRKPLRIDNPPRSLPEMAPPKLPVLPRSLPGAPDVLTGTDSKRPVSQPKVKEIANVSTPLPRLPRIETNVAFPVVDADAELESAVREVLSENMSFRQVQFIVKDGRVYLRSLASDTESLRQAGQAVSRLPNVVGVTLVGQKTSR